MLSYLQVRGIEEVFNVIPIYSGMTNAFQWRLLVWKWSRGKSEDGRKTFDSVTEIVNRKCYHWTQETPITFRWRISYGKFTSAITAATSSLPSITQAFRICCGEKMKELVPNTVEASGEIFAGGRAFRQSSHKWARWSTPWRMFTIFSGFLWRGRKWTNLNPGQAWCLNWEVKSRWLFTHTATLAFG